MKTKKTIVFYLDYKSKNDYSYFMRSCFTPHSKGFRRSDIFLNLINNNFFRISSLNYIKKYL